MPSSIPWPRGRRGLASRSRWKPCIFYFPFTFARPSAGYRGRNQFHAEPGFPPPSLSTSQARLSGIGTFHQRPAASPLAGLFFCDPGCPPLRQNKTRRGGFLVSAVALLGLARRASVGMALVPATVAIVIHSTAAENEGRNGHGESDFHVGAFHRVVAGSLCRAPTGLCKPLFRSP